MFEPLVQSVRQKLTRRRIITAAIIGTVAVGCAVVAPPVIDALRYDSLVAEHSGTRATLTDAQQVAADAQITFESAAADSMEAYVSIGAFMQAVDPKLLANDSTLDDLSASRSSLKAQGGLHESAWNPGKLVLFDTAPTPRVPAATSPVTVEGLTIALDRNRGVVENFTQAAVRMSGQADDIHAEIARSTKLIEKVLASAAKYGTSSDVLKYAKASVAVKLRLSSAVGDLTNNDLDPISRFNAFKTAVAEVKRSHADAVAEEERIAREQKKAEERAAEEARQAEAEAKAAEEAERLAKEEAERKAAEEASRPKPTPTPTPTPDPTPTPGVPTPTPAPED